ncbi:uncharacterized protein LOC124704262 isoform X1 [Lolium rigidum]|uniref:uncharacterized protein LOC124704262 isoform X1 n=1 Tax=Lolium rigidum TaxID=89674 RepID=UPI001F5C59B4|nr:uncharacterized protein LOC124704262 isoform X1 [Lolium rigidum]
MERRKKQRSGVQQADFFAWGEEQDFLLGQSVASRLSSVEYSRSNLKWMDASRIVRSRKEFHQRSSQLQLVCLDMELPNMSSSVFSIKEEQSHMSLQINSSYLDEPLIQHPVKVPTGRPHSQNGHRHNSFLVQAIWPSAKLPGDSGEGDKWSKKKTYANRLGRCQAVGIGLTPLPPPSRRNLPDRRARPSADGLGCADDGCRHKTPCANGPSCADSPSIRLPGADSVPMASIKSIRHRS